MSSTSPLVLAADIGGTKTHVGLFAVGGGSIVMARDRIFQSRVHASFEEILSLFLGDGQTEKVSALCVGVAGAIEAAGGRTTNLRWALDREKLSRLVGAEVLLVNDLVATAVGIQHLPDTDFVVLNRGD